MVTESYLLCYIFPKKLAIWYYLHITVTGSCNSAAWRANKVTGKKLEFSHSQRGDSSSTDNIGKQQLHPKHHTGSNWWSSPDQITI